MCFHCSSRNILTVLSLRIFLSLQIPIHWNYCLLHYQFHFQCLIDVIVRECSEFREWARAGELSVATELRAGERRNLCVSSGALDDEWTVSGNGDWGTRSRWLLDGIFIVGLTGARGGLKPKILLVSS
jgi:hypothetical protein